MVQVLFCISLMFVVLSGLSHVCFENIFKRISSSNDCIVLNVIHTPNSCLALGLLSNLFIVFIF